MEVPSKSQKVVAVETFDGKLAYLKIKEIWGLHDLKKSKEELLKEDREAQEVLIVGRDHGKKETVH